MPQERHEFRDVNRRAYRHDCEVWSFLMYEHDGALGRSVRPGRSSKRRDGWVSDARTGVFYYISSRPGYCAQIDET